MLSEAGNLQPNFVVYPNFPNATSPLLATSTDSVQMGPTGIFAFSGNPSYTGPTLWVRCRGCSTGRLHASSVPQQ